MNNKARKALNACFGSVQFSNESRICKKCQHFKHYKKIRRTKAGELL